MNTISEAVVLMAGAGSRLSSPALAGLKPLTPILGRPLISFVLEGLNEAGIRTVHAVVGYQSESLMAQMKTIVPPGMDVRFIPNPDWQKQNGVSVLAAKDHVQSPFVLTMSDHLFDNELLDVLLRNSQKDQLNLAIDRKIETIVDINDAMKVRTKGDRIAAIGKDLLEYDAIDTGFFVANEQLFEYLEMAGECGDCSLADGVRLMAAADKARTIDVVDAWWQDVDTPATLLAAQNHLRSRLDSALLTNAGAHAEP